jgi:hypothetical protein
VQRRVLLGNLVLISPHIRMSNVFLKSLKYWPVWAIAASLIGCECETPGRCGPDQGSEADRKCEFNSPESCARSAPGCVVKLACRPVSCSSITEKSVCKTFSHCYWLDKADASLASYGCCDDFTKWPDCDTAIKTAFDTDSGACSDNPACVLGPLCSGMPTRCAEFDESECFHAFECKWISKRSAFNVQ